MSGVPSGWWLGVPHRVAGGVARSVSVEVNGQREHIGSVIAVGGGYAFPVVSVRSEWLTEVLPRVCGVTGAGEPWYDPYQLGAAAVFAAYVSALGW